MPILDRYVLRQFFASLVICYLSLTGLYVVFDAFTNLEEFMRCTNGAGELFTLMGRYYGYRSIMFFDRTSALLALIATLFTVAWLQRHNEMTAIEAAGVSRMRAVRPLIWATAAVAALAACNREMMLPQFRGELARKNEDLTGETPQELSPRYDNLTDVLIRGRATVASTQTIDEPNFLLPPGLDEYGKQLVAEEAVYVPPQGGRPGGYLFKGIDKPEGLDAKASLACGDRKVLITPHDASEWLNAGECFVVSELSFEQLAYGTIWRQFSSTAELIQGLRNRSLDFGADVRVTIHSRLVQPVLDMTLLFLGLPLILNRQSRNVFVAIGLGIVIVSVFMLVVIGFQHLGAIYAISPALAAWAPLMLFVPLAAGMSGAMWE